jgi:type I restriction enzyme S subunit
MIPEILLQHFENVSEAPDAVPRLRELILHLAVKGKIVEHDRDDQSREILAKALKTGIDDLANKCNRCRWAASKPVNDTEKNLMPYSWTWARVNDTGLYVNGIAFKPTDWKTEGFPIIRIQNLSNPTKELNYAQGKFPKENIVCKGDLLVSWSATLDAFVWDREEAILNQHIFKVIVNERALDRAFLYWLLKHTIRELAESDHAHGLAMKHINRGPFLAHPVAIPPLAEQHRIVAKVDELMKLCDELEATQAKRERRRDRLVAATLHGLNNSEANDENGETLSFEESARFYFNHIPRFTTHSEHIQQLRQAILNLAVRGKLVPQDPNDEAVISLLNRIAIEQCSSIKDGGLKKQAGSFKLKNTPHSIPSAWHWVSLADLIIFGPQNGVSPKKTSNEKAPKALTLTATTSGNFDAAHYKHVELHPANSANYWLYPGDVLFQRGNTREYVGIAAIFNGPQRSFVFPDLMIRVRFSKSLDLRYIHMALISPPLRYYFSTQATGASSTMPKISQGVVLNTPIPLPSLAEQHRIVARVDELMKLCDELEARITTTSTTRCQLLEATLKESLAV